MKSSLEKSVDDRNIAFVTVKSSLEKSTDNRNIAFVTPVVERYKWLFVAFTTFVNGNRLVRLVRLWHIERDWSLEVARYLVVSSLVESG